LDGDRFIFLRISFDLLFDLWDYLDFDLLLLFEEEVEDIEGDLNDWVEIPVKVEWGVAEEKAE
jgi:hypothetical protein